MHHKNNNEWEKKVAECYVLNNVIDVNLKTHKN